MTKFEERYNRDVAPLIKFTGGMSSSESHRTVGENNKILMTTREGDYLIKVTNHKMWIPDCLYVGGVMSSNRAAGVAAWFTYGTRARALWFYADEASEIVQLSKGWLKMVRRYPKMTFYSFVAKSILPGAHPNVIKRTIKQYNRMDELERLDNPNANKERGLIHRKVLQTINDN